MFNKGQLVHIPSSVKVIKILRDGDFGRSWLTSKPQIGVYIDDSVLGKYGKVFLKDEIYYIRYGEFYHYGGVESVIN